MGPNMHGPVAWGCCSQGHVQIALVVVGGGGGASQMAWCVQNEQWQCGILEGIMLIPGPILAFFRMFLKAQNCLWDAPEPQRGDTFTTCSAKLV